MKQVLQNLRTGQIELAEVPCPLVRPGHLLIQTRRSLISAGTERSLVEFGHAGLIGKARAQPEKVRQVLDKIRTDGLLPTLEAVFARLDEPLPLGYCNVGRVIEVGPTVGGFRVGDRVASNGPHAEIVHVPATLAASVPDGVEDDVAAFTVLGAIALHSVRLTQPSFGEKFAVIGLGLVGMLVAQFLRAHGCEVLATDTNPQRCELGRRFGFRTVSVNPGTDPVSAAHAFAGGRGVDGVVIAASAATDDIIHQAAQMCRKRGRIVLVGVVGLNLRRADFYEKELTFQVSCSYGPGRHDPAHESGGRDYPLPYVRWTVARNFEAVLEALASGRLDVEPLISHRLPQNDASTAYQRVVDDPDALGVLLTYSDGAAPTQRSVTVKRHESQSAPSVRPVVGVIGSGNFASRVLIPAIRDCGVTIESIASAAGISGLRAAKRFDAHTTTTDYQELLRNEAINVVFIATRHADHADLAAEALDAGKNVFVEKPLAISEDGLDRVRRAATENPHLHLMVGFNRRFAPHTWKVKQLLSDRAQPIAVRARVNAGSIPHDHWVQDASIGGGRILGEACHFIDLVMFLVGHPITCVQTVAMDTADKNAPTDTITLSLTFADGSIGTVDYWSNGPSSYPKEQIEVFSEGRAILIDNWRQLRAYGWPGVPKMRLRQDKGHTQEVKAFLDRVRDGGPALIPFEEIDVVTTASLAAVRSIQTRAPVELHGSPAASTAQLLPLVLVP